MVATEKSVSVKADCELIYTNWFLCIATISYITSVLDY